MKQRNYPDFIGAYLNFTKNQEASEKIHRWVAISIIAAALERKVFLPRGHYVLFPNIYTFIIGASGVVRKSTSTGIGVSLLKEIESISVMSERITAAALIEHMKDANRQFEVAPGVNLQQSASFAYASELIVFMREVFGSITELLTTFYDCTPHDCRKPWTYGTKGNGVTQIFGPCLNILGASTPQWLAEAIPVSQMEGGFASRVIFVVETEEPKRFIAWPDTDADINTMRPKLIEDLRQIHELVGAVEVTPEARKWFAEWYEGHMRILVRQKDLRFSGYYGRKADTLLKIAMVCIVSESNVLRMEVAHLERALSLIEVLELTMFEAFKTHATHPDASVMYKILDYMRGKGIVTHSEILRVFCSQVNHEQLVGIMNTIDSMKLFKYKNSSSAGVVYELNDELAAGVHGPTMGRFDMGIRTIQS